MEMRTLFEGEGYAMGKCRECRLVRQNPRLTEAHLRETEYDGFVCAVTATGCTERTIKGY